jgi:hypothetical protein
MLDRPFISFYIITRIEYNTEEIFHIAVDIEHKV